MSMITPRELATRNHLLVLCTVQRSMQGRQAVPGLARSFMMCIVIREIEYQEVQPPPALAQQVRVRYSRTHSGGCAADQGAREQGTPREKPRMYAERHR